jgi:Na+-translocating ferredoxin:NAD+ oxidoreductase RNF subunit RnfB
MSIKVMSTTLCFKQDQCVGCAICVDVCPSEALEMESTEILPRLIAERCTSCAICVRQCPTGAIDLPVPQASIQS